MDNYPVGAAGDPRAPYNEKPDMGIDVTARAVLKKETTIFGGESHMCVEYETDPDTGRRVATAYRESDYSDEELFRQTYRSPVEIIMCCEWICRQLLKEGRNFLKYELKPGHTRVINLRDLSMDCEDWEEEDFDVDVILTNTDCTD